MKKWTRFYSYLIITCCFVLSSTAQNKNQLKNNQKELKNDISKIEKLRINLGKTEKSVQVSALINTIGIRVRKELIESINEEIHHIQLNIQGQESSIDSLRAQLNEYRDQYEKMLIYAYKNRNASNSLVFVFSASDFNEAYKRLKYLKKIGEYRIYQAIEIAEAQKIIEEKIVILESHKDKKKRRLGDKYYEKQKLQNAKKANQKVIIELKKNQKELEAEIVSKQKEYNALAQQIQKIIDEEIRIAQQREAQRLADLAKGKKPSKSSPNSLSPEKIQALSKSFAKNKRKLPWPVHSGTGIISGHFGIREHHALEGIKVNNNGIDILTEAGSDALAVFEGVVVAVIVIPSGAKSAVLVQHGAYFTLYSNLGTVKVKKGQKVKIRQSVGTIKTDEGSKTELHFELWNGNVKQNPELWITKKS